MNDLPQSTQGSQGPAPQRRSTDLLSEQERRRAASRGWLWFGLRLALMVAVLGYLGSVNWGKLRTLVAERPRWGYLALAVVLFFLGMFVMINRWYMLLGAGGVRVPWSWAMRCGFLGAFFNIFVPGGVGGDAARVAVIYRGMAEDRSRAAVSIVVDRAVGLAGLFLVAAIAVLASWRRFAESEALLPVAVFVLAMSAATIVGLVLLYLARDSSRWPEFDEGRLTGRLLGALASYRHKVGWLALGVLISTGVALACSTALYCCVLAEPSEEKLSFGLTLGLGAVSNLANAIPLTPGGIGQGEAAFQHLAAPAGYAAGFTAFLLFRLAMTAANMVGAVFWLHGRWTTGTFSSPRTA